jgi:hypothetical protein
MSWSISFLYFFTAGLGVFFILFMAIKLRYFESTKYLFFFVICFYWIIFNANLRTLELLSSFFFEFNHTSYFIAFLGIFLRLYVMKMIYPVKSFSLKNLKHFIFPLIIIIGVIQSKYVLIDENILKVLQKFYNPIISTKIIPLTLFIIGFSHSIVSLIFVIRFCNKQSPVFTKKNIKTLIWLKITIFITLIFIILQLFLFLTPKSTFSVPVSIGLHILIIALILYIIFSPETVKKMRGCVYVIPEVNAVNTSFLLPLAFRGTTYDYWYAIIDDYISIKMPYLNVNFSTNEMASDLSISRQKVALILKYVYKMDFMEFINRYRVYYFLELSNDKTFNSLQVEDQAHRVGFYNKSDFYYYFRKYMTPLPPLNITQDKYSINQHLLEQSE